MPPGNCLSAGENGPVGQAIRNKYFRGDASMFCRGTPADGSCFYHSVAAATVPGYSRLSMDEQISRGLSLRRLTIDELSEKRWKLFWDSHGVRPCPLSYEDALDQFARREEWANVHTIAYFMFSHQLNIYFFDALKGNVYCGISMDKYDSPIFIMWKNHTHFELILRDDGSRVQKAFRTSGPIASHVRDVYAAAGECAGTMLRHIAS